MSRSLRTRAAASLVVLVALVTAVFCGWELKHELTGGGTPGTFTVRHCDTHTDRGGRPHRVRVEYRCQGSFTAESGERAEDVRVVAPEDHGPGDELAVEHVRDSLYEVPQERRPQEFVMGLGVAAALLAGGLFSLLTGYALRRSDDLRTAARSLPAPKVLGPVLAVVALAGVLTAATAALLR